MKSAEIIARLRIIRTPQIGPSTYQHLLKESGDAETALLRIIRGDIPSKRRFSPPSEAAITRELKDIARLGAKIIFQDSPEYPTLLRETPLSPVALCLLGDASLMQCDKLAIVGARNASHAGRRMAERLSTELTAQGYIVVSGMARGIDAVAHECSFEGKTIAVLAGGIDQIYPPENESLYHEIQQHGLIISEMPLGTEPQARLFPRRNRIIAGLCPITIVIESSPNSGSNITANFAADYGREVAAVPGTPLDTRNLGTLNLIRDGAHVIASSEDVLDILRSSEQRSIREPAPNFTSQTIEDKSMIPQAKQWIIDYLGMDSCPLEHMMQDIPANPEILTTALAELEMDGVLTRYWNNRVQLSDTGE